MDPPLRLTWYSSTAPVDPPDPPVPVTAPVLNPAQRVTPLGIVDELNAGAKGVDP